MHYILLKIKYKIMINEWKWDFQIKNKCTILKNQANRVVNVKINSNKLLRNKK